MKTCCNDVKVCLIYDYQFLDELTYKLKDKLQVLAGKKVQSLLYKYFCAEDIDGQIEEINLFLRSLSRIKVSYLHNDSYCLPDDRVQAILEKAIKIAGHIPCPNNRKDIIVDDSMINNYLLSSPRCVTYDSFNKFASFLCGRLGFKITAEAEQCNISFLITRKVVTCNLLYALKIKQELCNLGYRLKKTNKDCKIEYKLLMEKYPNCDLEYKSFVKCIVDYQLAYPIIEEVYASNLALTVEDGDAFLCTPVGNYSLTSITPTSLEELLNAGYVVERHRDDIKCEYTKY